MALKPCPFCGCEAYMVRCEPECCNASIRWVECVGASCGCQIWVDTHDEDEAEAKWNARYKIEVAE